MRDWFLTEANRSGVAAVLLVSFIMALVLLGLHGPGDAAVIYESADPVRAAFRALVLGVITSVTLVLTINQVVLSQELGPMHEQQESLEGVTRFMDDLESVAGEGVTPAEPSEFLVYHLGALSREAESLVEIGSDPAGEAEGLVRFARGVAAESDEQLHQMEKTTFGSFGLVRILLHHPYSRLIHDARSLLATRPGSLPEGARVHLERILDLLVLFGTAREHFKTLHFRRELLKLSQAMMLIALPALLVGLSMVLYYDPRAISGVTAGLPDALLIVCAAAGLAISPLVLLISYILRIATVTNRTLAVGPFVLDS